MMIYIVWRNTSAVHDSLRRSNPARFVIHANVSHKIFRKIFQTHIQCYRMQSEPVQMYETMVQNKMF